MNIYKTCEIRGDATTELRADLYRSWGLSLGLQLPAESKFVIGGDIRPSTAEFLSALEQGLCQAGLDVVNLGRLPTPLIYYAQERLRAKGCAIVTASHHQSNINGLKWLIDNSPPDSTEVCALQASVEDPLQKNLQRPHGKTRTLDITFDYVANLQETWVDSLSAQCHIVLNPLCGCWAGKARRYLHAVFPQSLISVINDQPDPGFAGRAPDCSFAQAMHELADAVDSQRADLGIAFDGDGDRMALVDNQGVNLTPDETTWIFMETFGPALAKQPVVFEPKFSDRIAERAKELGAVISDEASADISTHRQMMQSNALFGATTDGHYFCRDLGGHPDGLYAACRIIAFLAGGEKTLAQLRRECPPMFVTPDLSLNVSLQAQPAIMQKIRGAWSTFQQSSVRGLRIDTPGGWFFVSDSTTEPLLTLRFESIDWPALDDLVERFCNAAPELGNELWQKYLAALGRC
ncbi:MAG: hypothetical protein ACWGMZ_10225, partial [Thermoguttaceae bacterium]